MKKPKSKEILAIWDVIEEEEDDASTEYMFARVIDYFNHKIDSGDVAQALVERGKRP